MDSNIYFAPISGRRQDASGNYFGIYVGAAIARMSNSLIV